MGLRFAVVEATSKALAEAYAKRWRFDLGVFTNLSPDHLQTHGSWEHYLAAKAQLFGTWAPAARRCSTPRTRPRCSSIARPRPTCDEGAVPRAGLGPGAARARSRDRLDRALTRTAPR
ncbi:MAG: Mur ligase family protein [Nannocystaceae bacterium]